MRLDAYLSSRLTFHLLQVPRAASYSLKLLDTISSLQRQMAGEPYSLYHETTLPLQVEEADPPT
jgi:hypothetical protein